jgi:acetyl esterase/lipase
VISRYGSHASQVLELFEPEGGPRGGAVVLHGGFWRAAYDRHLMDELCRDLAARGWAAWNLEYRRLGDDGGGWPATFEDVEAGIGAVRASNKVLLDPGMAAGAGSGASNRVLLAPLVAIGHSAGGHLALWAAARGLVTHAVSQAGVTDLAEAARRGLSGGVVHELLPANAYPLASPAELLPLGAPQLLVHGEDDDTVPVGLSRSYHAAAVAAGDRVDLVTLPGVGHYEHLDPSTAAWRAVIDWLP